MASLRGSSLHSLHWSGFLVVSLLLASTSATPTAEAGNVGWTRTAVASSRSPNNVFMVPRKQRMLNHLTTRAENDDAIAMLLLRTRGGAEGDEEDSTDDETDSDSEDETADAEIEESEAEEDEYYDGEEEEEEDALVASVKAKSKKTGTSAAAEYDEPYFTSPTIMIYTTFAPLLLSRKIDMFQPGVVRTLRFLFIMQLVIQQAFIFYVRIVAKIKDDRTPIHIESPLTSAMESKMAQQVGGGGQDMMKKLASSFLSQDTTVMEYDMKQAMSMQSGMVVSMLMQWVLHFKMQQVQPLLVSVISGYVQLVFNPLFQVYVLGRNLERPFKTPTPAWLQNNETEISEEDSTEAIEDIVENESSTEEVIDINGDDAVADDSDTEEADEDAAEVVEE